MCIRDRGYGGTPRIRRWPHPRTIGRHRTFFRSDASFDTVEIGLDVYKRQDNASLWQQAWASYAKSQMLRSPSALGGEDTQLMQAAERALKILNQKTEKDKQAGDGTSGLTREIFDWQTLADFASLGTRELAENIVTTRALKKAARSEMCIRDRS